MRGAADSVARSADLVEYPGDVKSTRDESLTPRWLRGSAVRFPFVLVGLTGAHAVHSADERDCLVRHASALSTVVELGVFQGASTKTLRSLIDPGGRLFAVDPFWPGRLGISFARLIARIEAKRVRGGTVIWLRMTDGEAAVEVSKLVPGGVDLVFSDFVPGDYEAHERLWTVWRDVVRPGGIFIQSMSQVVDRRTAADYATVRFARDVLMSDPQFECIETIDTFTVLRRRGR